MGKRIFRGGLAALGIFLLILDSRTALRGAQDAIDLCLSSVIPSIFPFLVLSGMLTPAICGMDIPFLRPLARILGIPTGSEGIFLTGILGGYPTGAQAVHQAWQRGQLNTEDAMRMLAFCSNAGPSFLFGILGTKFSDHWMLWALWIIHILSAIAVAIILPKSKNASRSVSSASTVTLTKSLKKAVITMGYICGWVILFRVMLAFLDRWFLWLLPVEVRVGIYGFWELANGCCSGDLISSDGMRFIITSGMLAFGGVCVTMQTASVTGQLGMGYYLPGKILQTCVSIFLSIIIQWFLFPASEKVALSPVFLPIFPVLICLFAYITRKSKKRGSIPSPVGV